MWQSVTLPKYLDKDLIVSSKDLPDTTDVALESLLKRSHGSYGGFAHP